MTKFYNSRCYLRFLCAKHLRSDILTKTKQKKWLPLELMIFLQNVKTSSSVYMCTNPHDSKDHSKSLLPGVILFINVPVPTYIAP